MQPQDLNLTSRVIGHQRYLFLRVPAEHQAPELASRIGHLGEGLVNLHDITGSPSEDDMEKGCYQILRGLPEHCRSGDIEHLALLEANLLIRLESSTNEPQQTYESILRQLIDHMGITVESLAGVQRPRSYTSHAMTEFAYAAAQAPGPGERYSLGVVTPLNKTTEWWDLDWMHRESFFLPRYDAKENMISKGHSLAAAAGISCITRRLMHAPEGYGRKDSYDLVGYFEFDQEHAPVFEKVMAALRDVDQNPEWKYVREGPEWWGQRVRQVSDLW